MFPARTLSRPNDRPFPRKTGGRFSCLATLIPIGITVIAIGGCPSPNPTLPLSDVLTTIWPTDAIVGEQGSVRITVGDPVSEDTKVTLSSSNSAVASIADSATIETGSATVEVPYDGVAPGTATINASLNGTVLSTVVQVVPSLQLSSIYAPGQTLQVGASSSVSVYLNITTAENVTVNLSSSNPDVVSVPGTVTIPAFDSGASVAVSAASPGSATISAELNGLTRAVVINTTLTPLLDDLSMQSRMQVGTIGYLSVSLDSIVAADTIVTLNSSNAAAITLPASVTVPAGSSYANVSFQALAAGSTTISASLNGSQRSRIAEVITTPVISYLAGLNNRMVFGAPLSLTVGLDATVAADTAVNVSSSNTGVATAPSSVTVPAGSNFAVIPITGVAVGSTTFTAALDGSSAAFPLTLVAFPTVNWISTESRALAGSMFELSVSLDAPAIEDTFVLLASSNPAVVAVPGTVTVPAGGISSQQTTLTAAAPGTTTLSASLNGVSRTTAVTVSATPVITDVYLQSRMQTGAVGTLNINTDVAPLSDTEIALNSTAPSIISVPASVTLRAGNTATSVPVTAGSVGNAFLTATLGPRGKSAGTTVVATPQITSVGVSSSNLQVGAFGTFYVSFDAVPAADAIVTIGNSAPSVVSLPSSALLERGNTFISVGFNAIGAGLANLTASAFGSTQSTTLQVGTTPVLSSMYAGTVLVGGTAQLYINLDMIVAADTVVTLTQDNPAALSIPGSATVGANTSYVSVTITGLANATSNVTATLGASTITIPVTPTPP